MTWSAPSKMNVWTWVRWQVGDQLAGVDDDAGGQFAEVFDGGFAGEDAQQRLGAAAVGGGGL